MPVGYAKCFTPFASGLVEAASTVCPAAAQRKPAGALTSAGQLASSLRSVGLGYRGSIVIGLLLSRRACVVRRWRSNGLSSSSVLKRGAGFRKERPTIANQFTFAP